MRLKDKVTIVTGSGFGEGIAQLTIPLGRASTPLDFANATLFLASDEEPN